MRIRRYLYLTLFSLLLAGCEDAPPAEPESPRPVALASVGAAEYAARVSSEARPYQVEAVSEFNVPLVNVEIEWVIGPQGGTVTPARSATSLQTAPSGKLWPFASAVHTVGPDEGLYTVTASVVGNPAVPPLTLSTAAVSEVISVNAPDYWDCYAGDCVATFDPAEIEIAAGQSVGWNWVAAACNVVFEDNPSQPVSSGMKDAGRHVRTFTEPGSYRYRCTFYSDGFDEGMVGVVHVR